MQQDISSPVTDSRPRSFFMVGKEERLALYALTWSVGVILVRDATCILVDVEPLSMHDPNTSMGWSVVTSR